MKRNKSRPGSLGAHSGSKFGQLSFAAASALLGFALTSTAHAADEKGEDKPADAESDAKKDAPGSSDPHSKSPAKDDTSAEPATKSDSPTEPAAASEPESTPAKAEQGTASAAPTAALPAPPGDVARWPAESYPADPIRGIPGGSLWLTFHGLQWPTSPFHADPPRTQLGLSGSAWVDNSYQIVKTKDPAAQDLKQWLHQARFTLRATPTYSKGPWFVQGQAELVAANTDEGNGMNQVAMRTDDLWVRAGQWNKWDVQAGRYQAWEIYHFGMGLDQNTLERQGADNQQTSYHPVAIYGVTYLYDRPLGAGNVAFHVYPTRFLRAELLGQVGSASGTNVFGVRPAVILDLGVVKVKGGAEWKKTSGQRETNQLTNSLRGGGAAIQVVLDPQLEFGVNGAYTVTDATTASGDVDNASSVDGYTFGGFANVRVVDPVIFGVGANYSRVDDTTLDNLGHHGEFSHFQSFAAIQALLLDQLFVKAVFGYAKADFAPSNLPTDPWSNKSMSGRLRLMYLF